MQCQGAKDVLKRKGDGQVNSTVSRETRGRPVFTFQASAMAAGRRRVAALLVLLFPGDPAGIWTRSEAAVVSALFSDLFFI
jgi:hypothetical protein